CTAARTRAEKGTVRMQVHIDPDVCQGHTLCALAAPEIFLLGEEDGHAYVASADVPAGREDVVRKAVATCPEGAISIEE
ncbi:MAG: ferredoxin, partial [Acidimicrobiales bacterium]